MLADLKPARGCCALLALSVGFPIQSVSAGNVDMSVRGPDILKKRAIIFHSLYPVTIHHSHVIFLIATGKYSPGLAGTKTSPQGIKLLSQAGTKTLPAEIVPYRQGGMATKPLERPPPFSEVRDIICKVSGNPCQGR